MKTAEEQLWRAALLAERARVEEIASQALQENKKTSVIFRPQAVVKPWSFELSYQKSLAQLPESIIFSVSEFDFRIDEIEFMYFLEERGLLHLSGQPRSHRRDCIGSHLFGYHEFMNDNYFQYAIEYEGKRHRYSIEEMKIQWKIFCICKIYLQASWDHLYDRWVPKHGHEVALD